MFKQTKLCSISVNPLALAACGGASGNDKETVRLQVWGPEKEGEKRKKYIII